MGNRLSATVCALLFVTMVVAQINPKAGYIITSLNDTIYGKIDYRSELQNARHCFFRIDGEQDYKEYTPQDISAYRFTENGKYYVSRKVMVGNEEVTCFLEYLIKGVVSLYYLPGNKENHYFFENEEGGLTWVPIEEKKFDSYREELKSRSRSLVPMFKVFNQSNRIKKKLTETPFNKAELSELTKDYHNEICTSAGECIRFEYDKDEENVQVEFYAGVGCTSFSLAIDEWEEAGIESMSSLSPSVTLGVDLHLPRLLKHFFVQSSLSFSYLNAEGNKKKYNRKVNVKSFITDLQIGAAYRFGERKWKPILQAGFTGSCFYKPESNEYFSPVYFNPCGYNIYIGYYGGGRLEYDLQKGSLLLNVGYKASPKAKRTSVEVTLGYKF